MSCPPHVFRFRPRSATSAVKPPVPPDNRFVPRSLPIRDLDDDRIGRFVTLCTGTPCFYSPLLPSSACGQNVTKVSRARKKPCRAALSTQVTPTVSLRQAVVPEGVVRAP